MGLFGLNFSAGLSKMQSKFQEDEYHEIRILSLFSLELLILSKKPSTFCCKSFSRVFDAASYVSRGAMTWEKHFVLELFLLSSDIQIKQFGLLVETSRHCCRKAIYVSRSWVWRKPFFCYFSLMNCSYWAKKFWPFWVNVVAGFLKLHRTCPEEKRFGENIFVWFSILSLDIELKQWGPLAEVFRQGRQKGNLGFKKTSPMKFVVFYCSPLNCWYWAKNPQPFVVKVLAGFLMMHPTCPEEQWVGKNTLSSNCFCYLRTFT